MKFDQRLYSSMEVVEFKAREMARSYAGGRVHETNECLLDLEELIENIRHRFDVSK